VPINIVIIIVNIIIMNIHQEMCWVTKVSVPMNIIIIIVPAPRETNDARECVWARGAPRR
jgi:hypothetical protein